LVPNCHLPTGDDQSNNIGLSKYRVSEEALHKNPPNSLP